MEIRKGSIGDDDVARIYTGDDIVHPLPAQDGLVLWYDFMGRRNNDAKRGIAEDLSGNGNDGTLTNFAYAPGSGYEDDREYVGRNLYAHSLGVYSYAPYAEVLGVSEDEIKLRIVRDGVINSSSIALRLNSFEAIQKVNTTYTVSGYIQINGIPISDGAFSTLNTSPLIEQKSIEINNGRFEVVFSTTETLYTYLIHSRIGSYDDIVSISHIKIEEGSVATPWRPAMEDPEYEEWAMDKGFRRVLRLDGVDDYVAGSQKSASASFDDGLTLEVSVKSSESFPSKGDDWRYRGILSKRSSGSSNTGVFVVDWIGDASTRNLRASVTSVVSFSVPDFDLSEETHILLVSSTSYSALYVNGEIIRDIHEDKVFANTDDVIDVGRVYGSARYAFEGDIFSARVYNRALTPEEIAHNYAIEKERWNL